MLASPGGWVTAAFLGGIGAIPSAWLLGLLAASASLALASLRGRLDPDGDLAVMCRLAAPPASESADTAQPASPPVPVAVLTEPEFADAWRQAVPTETGTGWMERAFVRWLSRRERLVLECAASHIPRWTNWTWHGLQVLGGGLFCLAMARHVSAATIVLYPAGAILVVAGVATCLPLASGFGEMMGRQLVYGIAVARPALYPLDLGEFMRITLKAAAIRGSAMTPVMAMAAWLLAIIFGLDPVTGALGGAKLALLSIGAGPYLCMMAISCGSNDSQTHGFRSLRTIALIVGVSLALMALGALTIFTPLKWSLLAAAAYAFVAWRGPRRYLRAFNHGRFDLVQMPTR